MHEVSTLTLTLTTAPLSSTSHRLQEKRQNLMEKLLPSSRLPIPRDVAPLLVEEKGKEDSFTKAHQPIYKSATTESTVTQQPSDTTEEKVTEAANETLHSSAPSASTALGCPATGERLFVFRDPPESRDSVCASKRKRKRNFLNLKKGSVAPTNLP